MYVKLTIDTIISILIGNLGRSHLKMLFGQYTTLYFLIEPFVILIVLLLAQGKGKKAFILISLDSNIILLFIDTSVIIY